jgi:DNA repair exonuclease SbcCD ATPase subunit
LVEQAMFFLAGVLVAGLAGLSILPAFARRSSRLSATRTRMFAPLSVKEAVAERDLLRAEHAVEQFRLERRITTMQEAVARHRADLGRQAANFVALESQMIKSRADNAELFAELAAKSRDILGLEGEIGANRIALNDFSARLEVASAEISSLKDKRVALETLSDEQRTVIAGLETRAGGLEIKLGDAAQLAKAEQSRLSGALAARAREVARLETALDEAMAKGAIIVADLEKKDRDLQEIRRKLAEMEAAPPLREPALQRPAASQDQPAGGAGSQGDLALREAIAQLAADVVRLSGASGDKAQAPGRGKTKRRTSQVPSLQGPDTPKSIGPAKLRQLQSTSPER